MTAALWTVAIVALIFLLREAASLLIPLVIAVLVSYALEPLVRWLMGRHVPRVVATSLVVGLVMGSAAFALYSTRDDALSALETLPRVARELREALWEGHDAPGKPVQEVAEMMSEASGGDGAAPPAQPSPSWVYLGVETLVAFLGHATVVVFLVFFLLLAGDHVGERLVEIAGPDPQRRMTTRRIIEEINAQLQRFLLVRLATAVVVALATWPVLAWIGVEHAAGWAMLAGIFNSIPYAGPVLVSGGLLVVVWAQAGDLPQALLASGGALAVTALEGWLLTPIWLGKAERMHVLAVFLGVLFWTWMWGAWGTVLAVPMLVVLKAVADRVPPLQPFGRLMAP
jgi:predicted PurR-regulated permease PerM